MTPGKNPAVFQGTKGSNRLCNVILRSSRKYLQQILERTVFTEYQLFGHSSQAPRKTLTRTATRPAKLWTPFTATVKVP
jgi:hypothetical protein